MRWVSFLANGQERAGRLIGDTVHALQAGTTLLSLLGDDGEALHRAGEVAEADPADTMPLGSLTLLPPIAEPPSIREFYAFESHSRAGRRSRGQEL